MTLMWGVAMLILVDQQSLTGANVGRHALGVRSISYPKASELAKRIRADLPHVELEHYIAKIQDLLLRSDGPLEHVDLIVSALGDWPAESLLDEWHLANGRQFPIVYGLTEPHATAGHAVIVPSSGGSFRDGLNETGEPDVIATHWPDETRCYEPACGAAFEPYGPSSSASLRRSSPRLRSTVFSAPSDRARIACGLRAVPSSNPRAAAGARCSTRSLLMRWKEA